MVHNLLMNIYNRHRFPSENIRYAVWLYHRFNLSYRDIEDLLFQRGVVVSYETIRQWCIKFGRSMSGFGASYITYGGQ